MSYRRYLVVLKYDGDIDQAMTFIFQVFADQEKENLHINLFILIIKSFIFALMAASETCG